MTLNTGTPAGDAAPRDGDTHQQSGTEVSRNATSDGAADGTSDEDELDKVDDPTKLREMLREMRTHERRRNDGYNTLKSEKADLEKRLQAIEADRAAGAPVEERVKQLENDLKARDERIARMEKERKDERTDADIAKAARALNAADPDDVVRLIDRDELTIDDDGKASNAEQVVRALLKKKPHLVKGSGGGADGGARGSSGRGSSTDMNDMLRQARRRGTAASTTTE